MMAAGRLHLETINRHQWAEEVAVPKLADPIVGESELSAGTSAIQTREKQSPEGCQMQLCQEPLLAEGTRERPVTMEMRMISARMFLAGYRMTMRHQRECHSRSVQTLQVQSRSQ